ncbi:MAG: hypothetical protein JJ896_13840 [Rhodothermales bacterium]|nr:hypothetical protein [Rhodothermales bacterium]MBO6780731.1 hypothetical protein [Rhodothermales bacterium]
MGQQQLLLLVLGIVIVGLAVVVGIQAFSENQKKANADALVNDAIRIASDAQAWKLKPAAFGGGASATNWTGLTLLQLGYDVGDNTSTQGEADDDQYENLNGIFDMSASGATLTILGTGYNGSTAFNTVRVTVTGTEPSDITTLVNPSS